MGAYLERLWQMDIPLGTTYSSPLDIGLNAVTKNWMGYIKVHLQHLQRDGLALLQDSWAFIMEMENGELIIGKIEKGYEFVTKVCNLRLHLKGESLYTNMHTTSSRPLYERTTIPGNNMSL